MTLPRTNHLRLVTTEPAPAPVRAPRLRFQPVMRLEDGSPFGFQLETDMAFEDFPQRTFANAAEYDESSAGQWLGELIERTAKLAQDSKVETRPIGITAPLSALTDRDAPMAAEAGARRCNLLPQEIRIDFIDASLAALEDLAMERVDAFRARGFRVGLDARKTWYTPMSARARITLEAIRVDPATLRNMEIPVSRVEIASAEGVALIAENARWRDTEELAEIGIHYAIAPRADS